MFGLQGSLNRWWLFVWECPVVVAFNGEFLEQGSMVEN
jgi:hypothetical protein